MTTVNEGFWDLSPEERGWAYDRACERAGVSDFWDLSPEERGRAYREAVEASCQAYREERD